MNKLISIFFLLCIVISGCKTDGMIADDTVNKRTHRRYERSIKKGDANYAEKNYTKAKDHFEKANTLKPLEVYPKEKLLEITSILTELRNNAKCESLLKEADYLFQNKEYKNAMRLYSEAYALKPKNKEIQHKMDLCAVKLYSTK